VQKGHDHFIILTIILGAFVGFVAAIPVGPLNLFAITQVLKRDFFHGFLVGLVSSFLDATYCFLALLGVSHIMNNLNEFIVFLKIAAALLLLGISIRLYKQSKSIGNELKKSSKAIHRPILTAFFLYITNPALYAFWLGVAGMMRAHRIATNSLGNHFVIALSVGLGAVIWYLILMRYVAKYHHQFKPSTFRKIFLIIASVLVIFALYTLYTIF